LRDAIFRERNRFADSFRLLQVTPLVTRNDLEAGAHGESNPRKERIAKPNAVHVLGPRFPDQFAACLVTRKKSIQDGQPYPCPGPDFGRRTNPLAFIRRLHKFSEKPPAEPAWSNVFSRRVWSSSKRGPNRWQIRLIGDAQMLETLADAPRPWSWLPIQLFVGEARH